MDRNITDEGLLLYSSANVKILDAKRLNRKVSEVTDNVRITKYVPAESILFTTFAGTVLPRIISIFLMSLKVETYSSCNSAFQLSALRTYTDTM